MTKSQNVIEIDDDTADRIVRRAAEMGVSSSEVVAILLRREESDLTSLAELERRWSATDQTVPHGDVRRWLETWGTPAFEPWGERP